jgi:hypothetical protein
VNSAINKCDEADGSEKVIPLLKKLFGNQCPPHERCGRRVSAYQV